jgi:hypothetical protein
MNISAEATTENDDDLRATLVSSIEQVQLDAPTSSEQGSTDGYEAPVESAPESRVVNRDETGKFAPKGTPSADPKVIPSASPAQEGIQAAPKAGQPPSREWSAEKAPQAWKPEAREYWQQLPEPVRREVVRHAQAANDAISQNVEARKFSEAVQRTIAPFEHFIKAEGSNPVQAIDNLMSTAALLRTGTSEQIAQLVAQITNQFGVGRFGNDFITRLDGALAGRAPATVNPEVAAVKAQFEQELAPLRQMQRQMAMQQQMAQQQQDLAVNGEIEQFSKQAEFLHDVRLEMADIIDMAAARGVNYSLQQAYEIACRSHPEIAKVLQQRDQAQFMQKTNQNTLRAKAAAVSVGGAPTMGGADQGANSLRQSIELALSNSSR